MATKIPDEKSLPQAIGVDEVLNNATAIAAVGIAALSSLEGLLTYSASKVECASCDILDSFKELSSKLSPEQQKSANDIIGKIIMNMQFQDRNTQLMQNAVCILASYKTMLNQLLQSLEVNMQSSSDPSQNVQNAIDSILSGICLGEVRSNFIAALSQTNVDYVGEDGVPIHEYQINDNIELA